MATPPSLTVPREGVRINSEIDYAKRGTAVRQAQAWNGAIADDPVLGSASGFVVGVGPRVEGRYPLVWVVVPH